MPEIRYYSFEEIKQHDGKNGERTWIVYKDSVYDVTEYLAADEHPGESELIREWAGKNATKAFNDVGHSTDALKILKQFKIGEVVEEERKSNQKKSEKNNSNGVEVKTATPEKPQQRSCISVISCGLCG